MVEAGKVEFKWGKKKTLRGKMKSVGGKKIEAWLYESFIYDGVEYNLYDSVYLYKKGEPEPFIGKLIKIWENDDNGKRVKILWYFRPCEILNFLEGHETLENELFLASGEGLGLSNINPLEAIAGKCNVVCISKDRRNPQPSDEELQMADFVFYRFFDVGRHKISDKVDDYIAGIAVKNIFNKLNSRKLDGLVTFGLDEKEVSGNVMMSKEAVALSSGKKIQPLIAKSDAKYFDTLIEENADSKPSLGEKRTSNLGLKDTSKCNDALYPISNYKTLPHAQVKENGVNKASLVKQKSSTKLSHGSRAHLEMTKIGKTKENLSIENTILRSKVDSENGERKVVGALDGQINKRSSGDKAFEKEKYGGSSEVSRAQIKNNVQNRRNDDDDDDDDDDNDDDLKEVPYKKLKIETKPTKLSRDKFRKESSTISPNLERKLDYRVAEVTQRPDVDKSKWFKARSWEEDLKIAYDQGKLVLLENLDPSLTSSEVQDIIWLGFKESCTAKPIQRTASSSPDSGQAFVIFKRKEAAELVIRKLEEGCFLMSNGRPLVGSFGVPCFPDKKPIFYGHHVIDQLRLQNQREMKDAVSTSHCSQPNNIEYDMAVEWCLLQEREDRTWRRLYQRQGEELSKLKAKLKSKI